MLERDIVDEDGQLVATAVSSLQVTVVPAVVV